MPLTALMIYESKLRGYAATAPKARAGEKHLSLEAFRFLALFT